jgi:hypothetical protein
MLTSRRKKNKYFHHFRDFLAVLFVDLNWSAWSTPFMYMLYNFTGRGHGTSFIEPSFCFRPTDVASPSQLVDRIIMAMLVTFRCIPEGQTILLKSILAEGLF